MQEPKRPMFTLKIKQPQRCVSTEWIAKYREIPAAVIGSPLASGPGIEARLSETGFRCSLPSSSEHKVDKQKNEY